MGMDMGAYVVTGISSEGYEQCEFAPMEPFKNTFFLGHESERFPQFQFHIMLRSIISDVLGINAEDGELSIKPEELEGYLEKLEQDYPFYTGVNPGSVEDYKGLIEFFTICNRNGYRIISI